MFYLFLVALALVMLVVRTVFGMPATNFGSVQVSDGYAAPVGLWPAVGEHYVTFLAGGQTVGTEKSGFLCPYAGAVVDVRAYLTTAPTGAAFVVDLMKNGVTMFTTAANRPTIAISGFASTTTLPDVTAVAVGDRLRVDVITVGSTIAGSNLYVAVTIRVSTIA